MPWRALFARLSPWGAILFAALAGGWTVRGQFDRVDAELARKADVSEMRELEHDVRDLTRVVQSNGEREQEFFCRGQPRFCR